MPEDRTILEPSGNLAGRQPFAVTIVEGATEGSNVAGATIVEAPVGDGPEASASVNLIAGGHFLTYRLVEPIKVASGEADLWLADGGGRRVVIKLYRWGVRPKAEIVEKLGAISRERIVDVYERGVASDGRNYEVLEYIRHGSLAELGRGGLAEATVRVVLTELCDAVAALHNAGILHRDLKPANILVRTLDPLDLVLTDFGISSVTDVSLHATSANRTAAYSSPEALTGVVGRASDWWSIGVILLELLSGLHPFEGIDERVVNFTLVTRGITVPENLPAGWGTLIRGLLTRDHAQRWSEEQVRGWLSGRRDIPVYYGDAGFESPAATGVPYKPYKFRNQDYASPPELAVALAEHPDEGLKHLGRGFLTQWVKDDVKDFDLASRLMDVMEDQRLTAELRLTVAVLAMNAQLPLTWHGDVLNREWLTGNVDVAVRLLESSVPDWLEKLREDRWLVELREHRRTLLSDLKPYDSLMDKQVVDMLTLLGDEKAQEIAAEVRRTFAGSTNDQINCLFSKTALNSPEAILLAGSQRKLLLTPEQSLMSRVRKKAAEALVALESGKLPQVAKMGPDQLAEALGQLQCQYVDSTNATLAKLLQAKELPRDDSILLLSCKSGHFLTLEQSLIASVQERARGSGVTLDQLELERVAHLSPEQIGAEVAELQQQFAGSRNNYLTQLLHAKESTLTEFMVLLSCKRESLLTPADLLSFSVRQRAQEMDVPLDLKELERVVPLGEEEIARELGYLRQRYGGSRNARLAKLLKAGETTVEDSILLLSCKRTCLLLRWTREHTRKILKFIGALFCICPPFSIVALPLLWLRKAFSIRNRIILTVTGAILLLSLARTLPSNSRGRELLEKGDYDAAIAEVTKIIWLNPYNANAYAVRGAAYYRKGNLDKALEDCSKALQIDSRNDSAYAFRGLVYQERGEDDKAIDDLKRALDINPNNEVAYAGQGSAYLQKGDYKDAIDNYDKAISLKPRYANAYDGRGEAFFGANNIDKAMADLSMAIEIDPRNAAAYTVRGTIYQGRGDLDNALTDSNRAIAIDPENNALAYATRGEIYRLKGNLDNALADSNKAIAIDPKNAFAYLSRGEIYRRKSDLDKAVVDLDEAVRLDLRGPIGKEANDIKADMTKSEDASAEKSDTAAPAKESDARQGLDAATEMPSVTPVSAATPTPTGKQVRVPLLEQTSNPVAFVSPSALSSPIVDAQTSPSAKLVVSPGDEVTVVRAETLFFRNQAQRRARVGEKFVVAADRLEMGKVFVMSKDDTGRDIALSILDTALRIVPVDVSALLRRAINAAEVGNNLVSEQLLAQAARAAPNEPAIIAIRRASVEITSAQATIQQLNQTTLASRVEAARLRRNADVIDGPNVLNPGDTSNQQRAQEMRDQAGKIQDQFEEAMRTAQERLKSAQDALRSIDIPNFKEPDGESNGGENVAVPPAPSAP